MAAVDKHSSLFEMTNLKPTCNILSFDGGGIRGYMSVLLFKRYCEKLQQYEIQNGHAKEEEETLDAFCTRVVREKFDLICGTSIGGIVALMFALETPISEIIQMFQDKKNDIFRKEWLAERLVGSTKYESRGISAVAVEVITKYQSKLSDEDPQKQTVPTEFRMKDVPLKCAMASFDLETNNVMLFHNLENNPAMGTLNVDLTLCPVVDVALSTSAAPTYFPIHSFALDNHTFNCIDGGIWANDPRLAVMLLLTIDEKLKHEPGPKAREFCIQAFGTGKYTTYRTSGSQNAAGWMVSHPNLLDVIMGSSENMVDRMIGEMTQVDYAMQNKLQVELKEPMGLDDVDSLPTQEKYVNDLGEQFFDSALELAIRMGVKFGSCPGSV